MQHFQTILDGKHPHNIGTLDFVHLSRFLSFGSPQQPRTRVVGRPALSTTLVSSGHLMAKQNFLLMFHAQDLFCSAALDFSLFDGLRAFPPPHQQRTRVVGHPVLSTTLVSSGHSVVMQNFQMVLDVIGPPNTGTLDFIHLGRFSRFRPPHQPRTRVVGSPVLSTTLVSSGHFVTMQNFQIILDVTGPPNTGTLDFIHLDGLLRFRALHQQPRN